MLRVLHIGVNLTMKFDLGATTFDLQDTEFYDKYELFNKIKHSHSPARSTIVFVKDLQLRQYIDQVYHNPNFFKK